MSLFDELSAEAARDELSAAYQETVRRCERLRKAVLHRELAAEDEVDEYWPLDVPTDLGERSRDELLMLARDLNVSVPGDPAAPTREDLVRGLSAARPGLSQWVFCYGNLMRLLARGEDAAPSRELAEEMLIRAQTAEPISLQLVGGDEVEVHPKSLEALLWFRAREFAVGWWAWRLDAFRDAMVAGELEQEQFPRPREMLERFSDELSWQLAVLVHAACEPGPRVDRTRALAEDRRDVPPPLGDLHPVEARRVLLAFRQVNLSRLTSADALVAPPKPDGRRASSWNIFIATMATRLKQPVERLSRDVSLASLVAQVRLSSPDLEDLVDA